MHRRTAQVVLGGTEYTVHAFNIGELEQVAAIVSNDGAPNSSRSFAILKLALLRAEPKIADVDAVEPDSLDQVFEASRIIMDLAGLKAPENPPTPAGAETPAV